MYSISSIITALILSNLVSSLIAYSENDEKQPTSLMGIIEAILNDAEFVSLKPQQQLRVLVVIYELLENHLKRYERNHMQPIEPK